MPLIATGACVILILALFWLDRERRVRTSAALLIPMAWLLIAGSRNISEWLNLSGPSDAVDRYMEGNPVDRNILSLLMLAGLVVLYQRRSRVVALLKANLPVVSFFLYAGLSVVWSDFPLVGGKRWFRGLGDVIMVLVILSEVEWPAALRWVFTRIAFIFIPTSILFIRYYPDLGRAYGIDGSVYWTGVASGKNSLGMICLIFGMACVWSLIEFYRTCRGSERRQRLFAHGLVVAMAVYLFWIADSKTSLACFVLVGAVMALTAISTWARKPAVVRTMMLSVAVCCFSVLFLGIGSGALTAIGRNSTLTGRTDVWKLVLRFVENPVFGAGYESFWMGKRLERIVDINGGINQAHNGYIEIYLNLGVIGVSLLGLIIVTGFRKVVRGFQQDPEACRIRMAYFLVAVVYNFTEGAFKMMSPVWISFLLGMMAPARLHLRNRKVTVTPPAAAIDHYETELPLAHPAR